MKKLKTSFISTVLNEGANIGIFINSILNQTRLPDEIIIIDGGSTDNTIRELKKIVPFDSKVKFIFYTKKGNRSIGRNEAIKKSSGDIILSSDSGNILDKNWVKNILKPFEEKKVDVVAGYYRGSAKTFFQKCLVPYVLVMPDKADPDNFLPATRSMAFRKSIWEKTGGFDEEYSHNEDFVFAKKLLREKVKIVFAKNAIVNWIPPSGLYKTFRMFYRFALGDMEAGIVRDKVLLLFTRYGIFLYLVSLLLIYKSIFLIYLIIVGILIYLIWAGLKNFKYLKVKKAIIVFIFLQLLIDFAVIVGSLNGLAKKIRSNLISISFQHKPASIAILGFILIQLTIINWGLPNQFHPFTYHMDEWHQSQAVRTMFSKGTPNIDGSANGTTLHFYLSGLYIIPFILLDIIDISVISNSISGILSQNIMFVIFRLNTLAYGIASIIMFGILAKRYFNLNTNISIFFFTFSPIWLSLNNYFKYDIALLFWTLLSLYFIFDFTEKRKFKEYLISYVCLALACSIKISALPLLPAFIISGYFIEGSLIKKMQIIILSICMFISVLFLFGMPDVLFGKGNLIYYLYDNLIVSPGRASNINLGLSQFRYLLEKSYMFVFGPFLYISSIVGSVILLFKLVNDKNKKSLYFVFIVSFISFFTSLLSIGITSAGNRSLVLLPFIVIFSSIFLQSIRSRLKRSHYFALIILGLFIQIYFSLIYIVPKISSDPRETSSKWIIKNIPEESVIGLLMPPVYMYYPDVILKDYYTQLYYSDKAGKYKYVDLNINSITDADYIIVPNVDFELRIKSNKDKLDIIKKISESKYRKINEFFPNLQYNFLISNEDFYMTGLSAMPFSLTIYGKSD